MTEANLISVKTVNTLLSLQRIQHDLTVTFRSTSPIVVDWLQRTRDRAYRVTASLQHWQKETSWTMMSDRTQKSKTCSSTASENTHRSENILVPQKTLGVKICPIKSITIFTPAGQTVPHLHCTNATRNWTIYKLITIRHNQLEVQIKQINSGGFKLVLLLDVSHTQA